MTEYIIIIIIIGILEGDEVIIIITFSDFKLFQAKNDLAHNFDTLDI